MMFDCSMHWHVPILCACIWSVMSDSAAPQIVAHQAPLSMEFSRQEFWSGLPFPTPGIFSSNTTLIQKTFPSRGNYNWGKPEKGLRSINISPVQSSKDTGALDGKQVTQKLNHPEEACVARLHTAAVTAKPCFLQSSGVHHAPEAHFLC